MQWTFDVRSTCSVDVGHAMQRTFDVGHALRSTFDVGHAMGRSTLDMQCNENANDMRMTEQNDCGKRIGEGRALEEHRTHRLGR
jgi:hypothetical protein